jgi:hypothetical protein
MEAVTKLSAVVQSLAGVFVAMEVIAKIFLHESRNLAGS